MELLRIKNLAMKFQILAEIAARQPDVQQRTIARNLKLSPQAVSDYIRELVDAGWLLSEGRSRYSVTKEGVDWMIRGLREWQAYSESVLKAITSVAVSTAIADADIAKGQRVGLLMRDGLLYATLGPKSGAKGIAVCTAKKGEDVGISNIEGIVSLTVGKVHVLRLPGIQRGGSKNTDLNKLKQLVKDGQPIGVVGIEALVAVRKAGLEPTYLYGAREAVIEAACSGLSPIVVCVEQDTTDLLRRLDNNDIDYELMDLQKR